MQVRLAYSIAIQVDFDILLLDEVLAVGDEEFQQKCFATFDRFREEGKTIVFVSHDLGSVAKFCERAVWLRTAGWPRSGPGAEVVERYAPGAARRGKRLDVRSGRGRSCADRVTSFVTCPGSRRAGPRGESGRARKSQRGSRQGDPDRAPVAREA